MVSIACIYRGPDIQSLALALISFLRFFFGEGFELPAVVLSDATLANRARPMASARVRTRVLTVAPSRRFFLGGC